MESQLDDNISRTTEGFDTDMGKGEKSAGIDGGTVFGELLNPAEQSVGARTPHIPESGPWLLLGCESTCREERMAFLSLQWG